MFRIKREEKVADFNIPFEVYLNDMKLGEILSGKTNLYDLKDGDYSVYVKCGEFISDTVKFSYDSHSTVELLCCPKYTDNTKFLYKYLMGKKGIKLIKEKDFYV